MSRTERTIVQHWRGIATLCAIIALGSVSWALWHRIDTSDSRYAAAAAEANRRGTAVSTLATDVRRLRAQVQAGGHTPVAPDPSKAISDLPARTEVPVPIPGPRGAAGTPGAAGAPGAAGTPGTPGTPGQPGSTGAAGIPGQNGVDGKDGAQGVPGQNGTDGKDGQDGAPGPAGPAGPPGPTCPSGYSLQPAIDDPDALVCRRDGAPSPTPSPSPSASQPAMLSDRRRTV